jgi:hypothetical protein
VAKVISIAINGIGVLRWLGGGAKFAKSARAAADLGEVGRDVALLRASRPIYGRGGDDVNATVERDSGRIAFVAAREHGLITRRDAVGLARLDGIDTGSFAGTRCDGT